MAKYTDGRLVHEGDPIRYKQSGGGVLAPSASWTYGVAAKHPHTWARDWDYLDRDELYCRTGEGGDARYYYIVGHIVEQS